MKTTIKGRTLLLTLLIMACAMFAACGEKVESTDKTDNTTITDTSTKEKMSFYNYVKSGTSIWYIFSASEMDKKHTPEEILIFDPSGTVTICQWGDGNVPEELETQVPWTLGDFSKYSDEEIISFVNRVLMAKSYSNVYDVKFSVYTDATGNSIDHLRVFLMTKKYLDLDKTTSNYTIYDSNYAGYYTGKKFIVTRVQDSTTVFEMGDLSISNNADVKLDEGWTW